MSREKLKEDLKAIIVKYLDDNNIDHKDSMRVIMAAPGIWRALCASEKMPKHLTYQMMMEGITEASISTGFDNMFYGRGK